MLRFTRLTGLLSFLATALLCTQAAFAAATPAAPKDFEKATFAAGCFWCVEAAFEGVAGVTNVISGYIGGASKNPTYEQTSEGNTGHAEAVEIVFNPKLVSYAKLLAIFWANTDPTDLNKQFCDRGSQYRSAIFTHNPEQAALAAASKAKWQMDPRFAGKTIHTELNVAGDFYAAEEYHQDYAARNPIRYKYYSSGCGRDKQLKKIWGVAKAGN